MKKRLCFGTMFRILIYCKNDTYNNEEFVGSFTRTIDPNCEYIKHKEAVSQLLSCSRNISGKRGNGVSNVKIRAVATGREELALKIQTVVDKMTIPDRRAICMAALLDVIENDDYIGEKTKLAFAECMECDREALFAKYDRGNIYFADLLAGIFLYVILHVKNKNDEQKEFAASIGPEYMSRFKCKVNEVNEKVKFECEFKDLVNDKIKKLTRSNYEGIDIILRCISKENSKEGHKFGDRFERPIRVAQKFKGDGSFLERSIVNNVTEYYRFIQDRFNELDEELDAYYNETWMMIRELYDEVKDGNKSNEMIYNEVIELLDATIPSSTTIKDDANYLEYLKIITSFFVQNCAIFKQEKGAANEVSK